MISSDGDKLEGNGVVVAHRLTGPTGQHSGEGKSEGKMANYTGSQNPGMSR